MCLNVYVQMLYEEKRKWRKRRNIKSGLGPDSNDLGDSKAE